MFNQCLVNSFFLFNQCRSLYIPVWCVMQGKGNGERGDGTVPVLFWVLGPTCLVGVFACSFTDLVPFEPVSVSFTHRATPGKLLATLHAFYDGPATHYSGRSSVVQGDQYRCRCSTHNMTETTVGLLHQTTRRVSYRHCIIRATVIV